MLQFKFLCHIQRVVWFLCTFILLSIFSTYLPFDHYCFHLNVNSLVVYVHHFAYFFSLGQFLWSLSVDVKGRSLGSVVTKSRWPGITTESPNPGRFDKFSDSQFLVGTGGLWCGLACAGPSTPLRVCQAAGSFLLHTHIECRILPADTHTHTHKQTQQQTRTRLQGSFLLHTHRVSHLTS